MDRIAQLKAFLESSPGDSFLQHALALEYIKLKDDATARGIFEALLEKEPGYVGSYYHLGRLLERTGERDAAIAVYEKGMSVAREARDMHAYNELQAAHEDLTDE
ncbi:tetratricopeptide repeat protein [Chitinophaga sp.]|uniref:tetratricopeptide repeat protein n=1 Tax=Chitinophaga sp. TaxID=1869181 RepID=UPI0031D3A87A